MQQTDFLIIGGGIVGISAAWQLKQEFPEQTVTLIEKESRVAMHQTGHNSGVVHAGVYYAPGSMKARFCREGLEATRRYCRAENIAYDQCGKLIVATNEVEHTAMGELFKRSQLNNLNPTMLSADELVRLEPNVTGTGAILIRDSAIVDYVGVCEAMARKFADLGGRIIFNERVTGINEGENDVRVITKSQKTFVARFLVCCGGLQADRLAKMAGAPINFRIVPYRGEYYRLPDHKSDIVKHLIYPVPDPTQPFLGIHLTRMIDGSVTVGPNALQGWKREGYGRFNFDIRDSLDSLSYPGFWKATARHLDSGLMELRDSVWKRGYLKRIQKYCPSIEASDLLPYPAGVRAQAVLPDGTLAQDFIFERTKRSLHVCNAPSPAATSAFPIGAHIRDQIKEVVAQKRSG